MSIRKLIKVKQLSGVIVVESGLHIGAGSDEIHIGGVDSTVIRNPITNEPYIPGSSLKGKIRSLVELATARIKNENPWATSDGNDPVARIFGNGSVNKEYEAYDGGPTRVAFRDCLLQNGEELKNRDALTEVKAEVSIDRVKGTAGRSGPRHTERVCQGACFEFALSYKVFDCGDGGVADEKNFKLLLLGMKLLEADALGGSGSRGYGRIRFEGLKSEGKEINLKDYTLEQINEFALPSATGGIS